MKYNQNQKISQVTEATLVIGVDVASEVQYARAFDYRGLELGIRLKFCNDADGFQIFNAWVEDLKAKAQKEHVIVGMEPTGHYWFNLAQHLQDYNMRVVLVNPFHVKRSQELDDNSPGKNDRKDPKTIAMLLKDGRYLEPYIPEGCVQRAAGCHGNSLAAHDTTQCHPEPRQTLAEHLLSRI